MPRWLLISAAYRPRIGGGGGGGGDEGSGSSKGSSGSGANAHFAGGDHALSCMAASLGKPGRPAHLLCAADRGAVMAAAVMTGSLSSITPSPAAAGVVRWAAGGHRVMHHVSLRDDGGGSGSGNSAQPRPDPGPCLRRLLDEADAVMAAAAAEGGTSGASPAEGGKGADDDDDEGWWVVLDADGAHEAPTGSAGAASLLEACAARWGRRVLVLVQNVHSLPFGPEGAAYPTPGLLAAWVRIGGALCPSRFVADYVLSGISSSEGAAPARLLPPDRVHVVPYAAWGAFGAPPFENVGERAAAALQRREEEAPERGEAPVVVMLKLNREKGADMFFALARRLPALNFLGVTADDGTKDRAAREALPNVRLRPPAADVGAVLASATALIAPSVWAEAYGMVVGDTLLRGVPCLVSGRGGLPEAVLGTSAPLPVAPMQLPPPDAGALNGPDPDPRGRWRRRAFPEQPPAAVGAWAAALSALLLDKGCAARYAAASLAAREAAHAALVARREEYLAAFFAFVEGLRWRNDDEEGG